MDIVDDPGNVSSVRKMAGKPIGLLLGILFGIAGAGTAVWYVDSQYQSGADKINLIVAEPGPIRIKPVDPGGIKVENQNKLVYERVPGSASNELSENVLPREEITKLPTHIDSDAANTVSFGKDSMVRTDFLLKKGYEERPPKAVQLEPLTPLSKEEVAPVANKGGFGESRAVGVTQETQSSAFGSVGAMYLVQLAALRTEEAAKAEWGRLSETHSSIIGELSPMILRADLAERGVFFRLSAGPFLNHEAARGICAELVELRVSCLVVRNP